MSSLQFTNTGLNPGNEPRLPEPHRHANALIVVPELRAKERKMTPCDKHNVHSPLPGKPSSVRITEEHKTTSHKTAERCNEGWHR